MLAGSTAIDLAMLIVAADDSVMPQTREHLEILQLLGIREGVIVITKCDLVDANKRDFVELEIRELVQGTFLETAEIVATSVHDGSGFERLRSVLNEIARRVVRRTEREWFRLAIDRCFVVQGHGTVVTGSVISGSIQVSDELEWLPRGETVRVRSLQNHDHSVTELHRGQRAAINLAGIPHEQIHRGQELATPGYLKPSRVLTVRLQALKSLKKPIRHRTPLRVYLGTQEVFGTLSLLDCDRVEPGSSGLAQLFLEDESVAVWGQPLVVRDSSAEHTLGGGTVLQPLARKIRRRQIEMLEAIERLLASDERQRLLSLAWLSEWNGVDVAEAVRGTGVPPERANLLLAEMVANGQLIELSLSGGSRRLHPERLLELENRLLETLAKFHREQPLLTNHDRQQLLYSLNYLEQEGLLNQLIERMLKSKKLIGDTRRIARADFKPKLSVNQQRLKNEIIEAHRLAGFQPPEPKSFIPRSGGNASNLNDIFEVAVAEGALFKIAEGLFLHAEWEAELRQRVVLRFKTVPSLTVAEIRDLLETTRKYTVPICEYLDRIGITWREGDVRTPCRESGSD
jgi:selenocysteine-specific elongation factor